MLRIKNIAITDNARQVLDRRRPLFKLRAEDVFALCYTSRFINRDGSTVEGFVPGYAISSWPKSYIGPSWALVKLAHGTEFHLMPRFVWQAEARYVMDLVSLPHEIFSIERVPANE